uniref:Ig-like domain-containing protein n=1 Tax=Pundamilia nyererei TaxID=303518 RepID=A0A3B4H141_9CICH
MVICCVCLTRHVISFACACSTLVLLGPGHAYFVKGHTGQDITLSCKYDRKYYGALSACWQRGEIPARGCSNQLISTDGLRVETRAPSRYELLGRLEDGDVSLTIKSLTEGDAGRYGCRVEIPGWFNDEKHHIDVSVVTGEENSCMFTQRQTCSKFKQRLLYKEPRPHTGHSVPIAAPTPAAAPAVPNKLVVSSASCLASVAVSPACPPEVAPSLGYSILCLLKHLVGVAASSVSLNHGVDLLQQLSDLSRISASVVKNMISSTTLTDEVMESWIFPDESSCGDSPMLQVISTCEQGHGVNLSVNLSTRSSKGDGCPDLCLHLLFSLNIIKHTWSINHSQFLTFKHFLLTL